MTKEEWEGKKNGCRVILGIDNMRLINVQHGRDKGDYILRRMEKVISGVLGKEDTYSRISGDCFSFVVKTEEREKVQEVYQKISSEMKVDCTVSGGAVFYGEFEGETEYDISDCAMFAMGEAKKQGKNKLVFYSRTDYEKWLASAKMEESILNDITNDFRGFSVAYQPQIFAKDYSLYGAEALIRYTDQSGKSVSPAEFIPILERNRTICVVGDWVLRTALHQCSEWRKQYMPNFHISVNLSYVQLEDEELVEDVREALEEAGLPGSALTLEITETGLFRDGENIEEMIQEWHQDGISLSLDDFGTGYSNFERMSQLEFDEIKVDKSLVNMEELHKSFLKDMFRASNKKNIQVCCEGIETKGNLFLMERLEPKIFQGFLFSRPRWPEEFEESYFIPGTDSYKEQLRNNQQLIEYVYNKEKDEMRTFRSEQFAELFSVAMSDAMAYAVVDLDTGRSLVCGEIWQEEKKAETSFTEEIHRLGEIERRFIKPADAHIIEEIFEDGFFACLEESERYQKKFCYRRLNSGNWEWVQLVLTVFEGKETKTRYLLCWLKNINETKVRERELREKAMRDSLTKAYTMEAFRNCAEEAMQLPENDGRGTLILFDVDDFKEINDRYGHQMGDVILKKVVDIMKKTFRKNDIVGRLGGDEFAAFVPGLTDRKILNKRMESLYDACQNECEVPVFLSAGIVNIYEDNFEFVRYRDMADMALYSSKRSGKNQYQYVEKTSE